MIISLNEFTPKHVIGLNRRAIIEEHNKDPNSQQRHNLRDPAGLAGCLGGIFYQSQSGYVHKPLERIAGLLLFRIAEGQFFEDGNKRTAVLSANFFLHNNGHRLYMDEDKVNELMWGFAKDMATGLAKYNEYDAVQYVFDSIMPKD